MTSERIVNKALAYLVRYTPGFLGRHRHRYRFYLRVKNSDLVLRRKLRHSRITVPLRLGDWIQYWLFMDGTYERDLVDFLSSRVKDKVFFDVGANVGSYSLALARNAKEIYSFEASAANAAILRGFVEQADLRNVHVIHRAVSETPGQTISLFTSPDTGGNNSQFYDYGCGAESATTITLDQFAEDSNIGRIDIIKMDIEGGELGAFLGADRILRKWHPLLMVEFNALVAAPAGWTSTQLYDLIRSHGYQAYELKKRKLVPFESGDLSAPDFYANLIFQHRS